MVEFSLTFTIIQSNIYDSNIYELRLIYMHDLTCIVVHVMSERQTNSLLRPGVRHS
jgi:hypothetical protein